MTHTPPSTPKPATGAAARSFATPSTMPLPVSAGEDLWVFGYGSLMWNPGFDAAEAVTAHLRGYHRRFCVYSVHYRGTVAQPGLVLGLDRGGSCHGMAFRVPAVGVRDAVAYLWEREMIDDVYTPRLVPILLRGHAVRALTFVVNRSSSRYCRQLTADQIADIIRRGEGKNGRNFDYLAQTVRQLERLNIPDASLHDLLARVRQRMDEPA